MHSIVRAGHGIAISQGTKLHPGKWKVERSARTRREGKEEKKGGEESSVRSPLSEKKWRDSPFRRDSPLSRLSDLANLFVARLGLANHGESIRLSSAS